MKTVLVTGFEPFGGETVNPSGLAAQALDGKVIAEHRVTGAVLPCVFGRSLLMLLRAMRRVKPALVLCVGLAGGRSGISVERVAINIEDAIIPDNAGRQPVDRQVARSGPVAYWSTLPIKAVVSALREAGLEAWVSQSAGTYVCNYLFYGLMRALARTPEVRGGFVHVPFLPEQAQNFSPSLRLEEIVRGLEIAIGASLSTEHDLRVIGGATH
jgi:pyroglutamyl-peptidase